MEHHTVIETVDSGQRRRPGRRGDQQPPRGRRWAPVVALAVSAAACSGTSAGTDGYDQEDLQQDVDALVDLGVTGVQARLVTEDGDHVVATAGVSDVDTEDRVDPNGYFRMASGGKAMLATVLLQLVGEGRLSLDDSVEQHLPGVVQGDGIDGGEVTVRQLLQHTSGILDDVPGYETPEEYYERRDGSPTAVEVVAAAMDLEPAFPPGEGWAYSGSGYVLAGMIVEEITGQTWAEAIDERVIAPLGLDHTFWPGSSPDLPDPHARAYERFPTGELVDTTAIVEPHAWGSHVSTTADVNRFFRALMDGELLGPAEVAEMQRTVPVGAEIEQLMPEARYGLGIFSRPLSCGGEYWGHPGGLAGFISHNGVTEDGRRSIVVSVTTALSDSEESMVDQERLAGDLVDRALCGAE